MRIDIVSIFPEFFDILGISLIGKARDSGALDLRVHNLRDFTFDRHRTVDDKPTGGGAGMVMQPEPWARALGHILDQQHPLIVDAALAEPAQAETQPAWFAPEPVGPTSLSADATSTPLVLFPSPAGAVFDQRMAKRLAGESHLVFGCGRYEGIDHRVFSFAAQHARVQLVSLGDYVLNGGEVAAMAMVEAIGRLVPGVIGNPESLTEESHEDGLLEYPSYTKPATWRGFSVPQVLLSGNHAVIEQWRHAQRVERTAAVRPDLLPGGQGAE